jgi:tRNA pseudouridine13 synthase
VARELRVIAAAGLLPELFERGGGELEGARRPYRVPLGEATVQELGDQPPGAPGEAPPLQLCFSLPPGSFALALLREVMKTEQTPEAPEGE